MVRQGSHKVWRQVADTADRFKAADADLKDAWNRFTDEELARHYPERDFPTRHVEAKAGSMILWLSQAVHQGHVPLKGQDATRMVFYICQAPRMRLPQRVYDPKTHKSRALTEKESKAYNKMLLKGLVKRRETFLARRMTSHAPVGTFKVFGLTPRTYGDKALETRIFNFSLEAEKEGLSAAPLDLRAVRSKDGNKRHKSEKTMPIPDELVEPLNAVVRGDKVEPCDEWLPASLRRLSAETRAALWRLNGF